MAFTKIVGAGIQTTTDVTVGNVQAGIITVTSIYGDASNLTGIPAGLGTALSQTQTSPLNKIYYTNQVLSIGSTITISPPASAAVAYTQYADIVVEQDVDLIIDDGDEFIPDILGLSTVTGATLSGVGGRVRADQFTNKAGTGAPTFTKGLQVTGVGTALLVTGDARVTGILTIGTSSVTLDGTNNQVNVGTGVTIHHTNGVQVGGNTVHSTGLTVNQINASGIVTATGGVRVGSSFLSTSALGLGATTTTGRNAGINTVEGTIVYNSTLKEVQVYKGSVGWTNIGQGFIEATGGIINDYTSGNIVYRTHIFNSSGTFNVSSGSGFIECLIVAGGGGSSGGSSEPGGGGGAGGLKYLSSQPVAQSPGSYTVTVGAGGAGVFGNAAAGSGATSSFDTISATGGGRGGYYNTAGGAPGGSGGGGSGWGGTSGTPAGTATGSPGGTSGSSSPPAGWGNPGGAGIPAPGAPYAAGGGGGAGAAGSAGSPAGGGAGGNGLQYSISGISTYYAGGGGGSGQSPSPGGQASGGLGGGANGIYASPVGTATPGNSGTTNTGGGGSGAFNAGLGGSGGSGIVVVRYQIGNLAATAKATGGLISYYNDKTIHTFTSSGTFTAPASFNETVEYVVIGGGGAGGAKQYITGGGGAGAYRTNSTPIAGPQAITIQVGAGGITQDLGPAPAAPAASDGTPSYFGTPITAPGGGGAGNYPSPGVGRSGGSGGGGTAAISPPTGGPATGAPFPGTIGATPTAGWGHAGGNGAVPGPPTYGAGGGGGAGGAGGNGSPTAAGVGGAGIQLPATFRIPQSSIGAPGPTTAPTPNGFDTSGKFWVAGGGAGSSYPTGTTPGSGGGPGGPYAGGGAGGAGNNGGDGGTNTGGGGGGSERVAGPETQSGRGGSGLVLIAYPS